MMISTKSGEKDNIRDFLDCEPYTLQVLFSDDLRTFNHNYNTFLALKDISDKPECRNVFRNDWILHLDLSKVNIGELTRMFLTTAFVELVDILPAKAEFTIKYSTNSKGTISLNELIADTLYPPGTSVHQK